MRNTELNTPREMGYRTLFVVTLLIGAAGLFGLATGVLNFLSGHGIGNLLLGGGMLAVAKGMMILGKRYWEFTRLDKQFAKDLSGEHLSDPILSDKLEELQAAEEALLQYQARYREPGYDIMRVQVLRQRIRQLLRQDDRLREHLRPDIVL